MLRKVSLVLFGKESFVLRKVSLVLLNQLMVEEHSGSVEGCLI